MGEEYNSMIFGTHSSEVLRNYCIGLEQIIPKGTSVIEETGHKRKFALYGETQDFNKVSRVDMKEKKVYPLELNNHNTSNYYVVFCMAMVRGFITKDGRVFYDEGELKRRRVHFLNESLIEAKKIFEEKSILENKV